MQMHTCTYMCTCVYWGLKQSNSFKTGQMVSKWLRNRPDIHHNCFKSCTTNGSSVHNLTSCPARCLWIYSVSCSQYGQSSQCMNSSCHCTSLLTGPGVLAYWPNLSIPTHLKERVHNIQVALHLCSSFPTSTTDTAFNYAQRNQLKQPYFLWSLCACIEICTSLDQYTHADLCVAQIDQSTRLGLHSLKAASLTAPSF